MRPICNAGYVNVPRSRRTQRNCRPRGARWQAVDLAPRYAILGDRMVLTGMHFRSRQWLTSKVTRRASRAGRLGLGRFRTEGPRRVALRPRRPGELALTRQLPCPLFLVVRARQRREERNEVINIS